MGTNVVLITLECFYEAFLYEFSQRELREEKDLEFMNLRQAKKIRQYIITDSGHKTLYICSSYRF